MKLTFNLIFVSSLVVLSMVSCADKDSVVNNTEQTTPENTGKDDSENPDNTESDNPGSQSPIWPVDAGEIVDGVIPTVPKFPENYGEPHERYWRLAWPIQTEYVDSESIKVTFDKKPFNLSWVEGNIITGTVSVPEFMPGANIQSVVLTKVDDEYVRHDDCASVSLYDIPTQYNENMIVKASGETEYCTYELYGEIHGRIHTMSLYPKITQYKTLEGELDGYWKNKDFKWDGSANKVETSPLYLDWETAAIPDEMNGILTPAGLIQLIMASPFLPANGFGLSYNDTRLISFNEFFRTVSPVTGFSKYSNCLTVYTISYYSNNNGPWHASTWIFPKSTIKYIPHSNGKLSLFVNPGGIMNINVERWCAHGNGEYYPMNTPNLYGLLSNALLALSPGTSDGLAAEIQFDGDSMSLFLTDSETCVKLLKATLLPLLQNDVYRARLLRSIEENPETSALYETVKSGVDSFEIMLDSTNKMNIGVNANKYKPERAPDYGMP